MVDSAYTSRAQVPAATRKAVERGFIHRGMTVLDFGGGKYDLATKFLASKGIKNLVFDTQLTAEHNDAVIKHAKTHGVDAVTLNNVLNVVPEEIGHEILEQISELIGPETPILVSVYEGDGTGIQSPTRAQRNLKAIKYLPMLEKAFSTREIKKSADSFYILPEKSE
jgi:hypothetical protein